MVYTVRLHRLFTALAEQGLAWQKDGLWHEEQGIAVYQEGNRRHFQDARDAGTDRYSICVKNPDPGRAEELTLQLQLTFNGWPYVSVPAPKTPCP